MTADERTRMLSGATQSTDWRRRGAIAAAVAVTLATVAVVSLNASLNFSNAPTKASASAPQEGNSAFTPTVAFPANDFGHRELLPYCEERWITQPLDQFVTSVDGTYQQRYFVCGQQFFHKENGTIFFYAGNEGDVLLYLNNTGLMWENAEEFNALLVFAEHRYFGKSVPFGNDVLQHMQFLSSTQALADYAVLIEALKRELDADIPVIGFGGSYGGMLSAWFRLKYPHVVDGVIAASAPVLHTTTDPENPLNAEAFQNTVVFDMTPAAGSSANCTANTKKAIEALARLGETPDGRATIAQELRLCDPQILQSREQAQILIDTVSGVFGNLAMGNFPYPSSYIMEGLVNLPAYPMRVACESLAGGRQRQSLGNRPDLASVEHNVRWCDSAAVDGTFHHWSWEAEERRCRVRTGASSLEGRS
jgi:lysosomal Pro-X carboxypeptidase